MGSLPPHTPRFRPIPLPSIPERQYVDGQLTPVTPHPNLQAQQIHEILQPNALAATVDPESGAISEANSENFNSIDSPGNSDLSSLYYDFKDPPSKIIFGNTTSLLASGSTDTNTGPSTITVSVPVSLRLLRLIPATKAPLKQLRVLLPTTTPISIIISNPHFVSILDILEAIYSTLHTPVSSSVGDDLDLPNTIYSSEAMTGSFGSGDLSILQPPERPFRGNSYDDHPFESSMSPALTSASLSMDAKTGRKIDYLGGRTIFAGLTRCSTAVETFGPITWELHTA